MEANCKILVVPGRQKSPNSDKTRRRASSHVQSRVRDGFVLKARQVTSAERSVMRSELPRDWLQVSDVTSLVAKHTRLGTVNITALVAALRDVIAPAAADPVAISRAAFARMANDNLKDWARLTGVDAEMVTERDDEGDYSMFRVWISVSGDSVIDAENLKAIRLSMDRHLAALGVGSRINAMTNISFTSAD